MNRRSIGGGYPYYHAERGTLWMIHKRILSHCGSNACSNIIREASPKNFDKVAEIVPQPFACYVCPEQTHFAQTFRGNR